MHRFDPRASCFWSEFFEPIKPLMEFILFQIGVKDDRWIHLRNSDWSIRVFNIPLFPVPITSGWDSNSSGEIPFNYLLNLFEWAYHGRHSL